MDNKRYYCQTRGFDHRFEDNDTSESEDSSEGRRGREWREVSVDDESREEDVANITNMDDLLIFALQRCHVSDFKACIEDEG